MTLLDIIILVVLGYVILNCIIALLVHYYFTDD